MDQPLFTPDGSDPGREHQACDRCLRGAWVSNDTLRVRGWLVFDGPSVTGKQLHHRVCPACQRKGTRS